MSLLPALLMACLLPVCGLVAAQGRVVLLGFDGADAATTQRLMDEGKLPNLKALAEQGSFLPLASTCAAESPVAWASLNSGQNPGKTGIAGFVTRRFDGSGEAYPDVGFQRTETRALKELPLPAWQRMLVTWPTTQAMWIGGAAVALVLALFLGLFLRVRWMLALPIAVLVGVGAGIAVQRGAAALPSKVENIVANITAVGGFWEDAARHGVHSVVIDGAMTWDRPEVENAAVLSGLGVPDVRGEYGSWCKYSTDPALLAVGRAPQMKPTGSGGRIFRVDERNGRIEAFLYGPYDPMRTDALERRIESLREELRSTQRPPVEERMLMRQKRDLEEELANIRDTQAGGESDEYRLFLPLLIERDGTQAVRVTLDGQTQTLREGQWSDWYQLRFAASSLYAFHAVTRLKVLRLNEPFELFVDFLHPDPAHPNPHQPISQPVSFAAELAREIGGDYETVGWACLTHALKDDREGLRTIDIRTFLEDIEFTHECRRKLVHAALQREDWRLLVAIESTPDRVQHICYQYSDPRHPLYDAAVADSTVRLFGEEIRLRDAIEASYRSMDRLVGEVRAKLTPQDTLLISSDHGFESFRRQCHLNNWLAEKGYLVLRDELTLADARFPDYIDWKKTKAYAIGLGTIFLNVQGREKEGSVAPADVPALLDALERDLLASEDNGVRCVRTVERMASVHSGPFAGDMADLMVGFEEGYRVSWSTSSGDIRLEEREDGSVGLAPTYTDNRLAWSGDHVSVSGELVHGILFSSRRLRPLPGVPDLLHVAPTALRLLGVPIPASYDRPPLELER